MRHLRSVRAHGEEPHLAIGVADRRERREHEGRSVETVLHQLAATERPLHLRSDRAQPVAEMAHRMRAYHRKLKADRATTGERAKAVSQIRGDRLEPVEVLEHL